MKKGNQLKSYCKKRMSSQNAPLPSSRNVSMRDIRGAKNASLYPGLQISGMTSEAGGFTLIELLVVVLIIGILAAVALPQYQKAVEKSRATQALTMLKSVAQAASEYYLANGGPFSTFDDLSIEIPWTGNEEWTSQESVQDTRSNADWSLQWYQNTQSTDSGTLYIGRLTGKYKGAGFFIILVPTASSYGKIYCVERTGTGIIFEETAGSYCEKIMKGTPVSFSGFSTVRTYSLP